MNVYEVTHMDTSVVALILAPSLSEALLKANAFYKKTKMNPKQITEVHLIGEIDA